MNIYELTLVYDGKTTKAKQNSLSEDFDKIISVLDGKVVKNENLGVRELAYKLGKSDTGVYLYFELELEPNSAQKLKAKLLTDEKLLRYLLIKK